MGKSKKKKMPSSNKPLISLFVFTTLIMGIGYASINSVILDIIGNADANLEGTLFIAETSYQASTNADYENSKIINCYETTMQSHIILSENDGNSSISYAITIYNNTEDTYQFDKVDYLLDEKTYDNENITITLDGISKGYKLLSKENITFTITFHYTDYKLAGNNILNSYLNFVFKKVYSVTYTNLSSSDLPETVAESETFTFSFINNIPESVNVYINDELISGYTYNNNVLTIPNITGDLKITGFIEEPDLLKNNLIPVFFDGENWKVADTTTEWYNYSNQEWANAVILKSGVTKEVGDIVNADSDVRGMFVWIPRYEYKISTDDSKEIFANFISKENVSSREGYKIHPAFTFGTSQLSGIWVGKFETSVDQTSACYTNTTSSNCNSTSLDIFVLPNVKSLREQTISTQFTLAKNFKNNFTNQDTTINSHMLKNIEWAASAYLSQSSYGKYGNDNYSSTNKEVYVNNSSDLLTGRSSGSPSFSASAEGTYEYDYGISNGIIISEENGIGASTTGNITGIYDMNGGTYEYVMGYLTTASSTFGATSVFDYAEFTETPESKYYDNYTSTSSTTACSGQSCYGHGFDETAGWYNDASSFVATTDPWIMRGGVFDNGSSSGIFAYSGTLGYSGGYATFRISLVQE